VTPGLIVSCSPTLPTPSLDFFEQSETPSAVSLEDFEQHRNTVRSATGVLSTLHDQSCSNPHLEPFHFGFRTPSLRIDHHSAPNGPRTVRRPRCGRRSLPVGSFPGSSSGTRLPLFGSGGEFSAMIHIWTHSRLFLFSKPHCDRASTPTVDIRTAEGATATA